jgi:hypothetical protein
MASPGSSHGFNDSSTGRDIVAVAVFVVVLVGLVVEQSEN